MDKTNTCIYAFKRGKGNNGRICGKKISPSSVTGKYCSQHFRNMEAVKEDKEKTPSKSSSGRTEKATKEEKESKRLDIPQAYKNQVLSAPRGKVILYYTDKEGVLIERNTGFIFNKEGFCIGRSLGLRNLPLSSDDIEICRKYKFKVDPNYSKEKEPKELREEKSDGIVLDFELSDEETDDQNQDDSNVLQLDIDLDEETTDDNISSTHSHSNLTSVKDEIDELDDLIDRFEEELEIKQISKRSVDTDKKEIKESKSDAKDRSDKETSAGDVKSRTEKEKEPEISEESEILYEEFDQEEVVDEEKIEISDDLDDII